MNPLDPYKCIVILFILMGLRVLLCAPVTLHYNVICTCVSYNIILQRVRSMHRLLIERGVNFDGGVKDVW